MASRDTGTIKDKVISIIADKMNIDSSQIHDDTNLEQDLGADSLDRVELMMQFEEEFGITIPDDLGGDGSESSMIDIKSIVHYITDNS